MLEDTNSLGAAHIKITASVHFQEIPVEGNTKMNTFVIKCVGIGFFMFFVAIIMM